MRYMIDYAIIPFVTGLPFFYAASTVERFQEEMGNAMGRKGNAFELADLCFDLGQMTGFMGTLISTVGGGQALAGGDGETLQKVFLSVVVGNVASLVYEGVRSRVVKSSRAGKFDVDE